jgi:hypothetical protein
MKSMSKLAVVMISLTVSMPSMRAIAADNAGKCPSREAALTYIKSSESRWAEQSVTNDMSVIREIIADDYIGVSSAGAVVTKDLVLQDISDDFISNRIDYVDVHFFSDRLAVAQGRENWEKKGGKLGSYIWTDTWLCRHGRWQIIASQDTPLPR